MESGDSTSPTEANPPAGAPHENEEHHPTTGEQMSPEEKDDDEMKVDVATNENDDEEMTNENDDEEMKLDVEVADDPATQLPGASSSSRNKKRSKSDVATNENDDDVGDDAAAQLSGASSSSRNKKKSKSNASSSGSIQRRSRKQPKQKPPPPLTDEQKLEFEKQCREELDNILDSFEIKTVEVDPEVVKQKATELNANTKTQQHILSISQKLLASASTLQSTGRQLIDLQAKIDHHFDNQVLNEDQKKILLRVKHEYMGLVAVITGEDANDDPVKTKCIGLGDVMIATFFQFNRGWLLRRQERIPLVDRETSHKSICGLLTEFVINPIDLGEYTDKERSPKKTDEDVQAAITGTSVVIVHYLVQEQVKKDKELNQNLKKPPGNTVAWLITGFKDQQLFKGHCKNRPVRWDTLTNNGEKDLNRMPQLDVLRARVKCMVQEYKAKGNMKALTVEHAWAWANSDDPSVIGPEGEEYLDKLESLPSESEKDDDDDFVPDYDEDKEEEPETIDLDHMPKQCTLHPPVDPDDDNFPFKFTDEGDDNGALKYFQSVFNEGKYLCGNKVSDDQPKPTVTRHPLKGIEVEGRPGKTAEVIAGRNVLSDEVVQALVALYSIRLLPFCRGPQGKLHRCFVTDPAEGTDGAGEPIRACFQTGKGSTSKFYRAFDAHKLERELLLVFEGHGRAAVRAKYGKDVDVFLNHGFDQMNALAAREGHGVSQ